MAHLIESISIPSASPGTHRIIKVRRWGKAGIGKKVYIQAGLHADESPGIMVAHHLTEFLDELSDQNKILGEIIVVPFANPIGMSQWLNDNLLGRYHLCDGGGNFNRDWPDLSAEVLSLVKKKLTTNSRTNIKIMREALNTAVNKLPCKTEKEFHRKALLSLSIDSDFVLDLHCDWRATLHLYANQTHKNAAMQLAREMGIPVVLLEESVNGGPFDESNIAPWLNVRHALNIQDKVLPAACASFTVELRGKNDVSDRLGKLDAINILNFLSRNGIIDTTPPPLPDALCKATPLDGCDMITAPISGLIAWHVELGDTVTKSQHVADIIDLDYTNPAEIRIPIHAGQDGILFSQHLDYLIRPGEVIGKIAGRKSLLHRQGVPLLGN